jgi:hypothetical protein
MPRRRIKGPPSATLIELSRSEGFVISWLLSFMFNMLAVPPLTDEQRTLLQSADDDRTHEEVAFEALLEHVASWPDADPGVEPLRLSADFAAILADPDAFRGELFQLEGTIQQRTRLAQPYQHAVEWFLRDEAGTPFIVYLHDRGLGEAREDGDRINILARFYKRIDAVARDGKSRSYPAFVGAFPRLAAPGASTPPPPPAPLKTIVIAVTALVAGFIILLLLARRNREPVPRRVWAGAEENARSLDASPPLPDDPAAALAELRRRADSSSASSSP